MSIDALKIAVLERENDMLRERIDQLEACLADGDARYDLIGLSRNEARLFGALMKRSSMSKEQIMAVVYLDRPSDTPQIKIVDVFVCKIRRKVERYGLRIETIRGQGYAIPPAMKALTLDILAQFSSTTREDAA